MLRHLSGLKRRSLLSPAAENQDRTSFGHEGDTALEPGALLQMPRPSGIELRGGTPMDITGRPGERGENGIGFAHARRSFTKEGSRRVMQASTPTRSKG